MRRNHVMCTYSLMEGVTELIGTKIKFEIKTILILNLIQYEHYCILT